jgi:predicted phage terminase large subunit-like protein
MQSLSSGYASSTKAEKAQILRDLIRRREARKSLIAFTRYTFPEYRPSAHHHLIAEKLEAVARGEIKRLMIFMPPRHGKSELASKRFPAWFVGANPKRNIIAASYNSDLATDFGREVRNIVGTSRYRAVFDTSLSGDSTAANRWHTDQGGMYVAAGIGTAVTGRGAHVFLIDDPFKDREEADSERQREKVWRWYTSTAYTRLESDIVGDVTEDDELWRDLRDDIETGEATPFQGAIIGIGTRWHEDDLFGRLLVEESRGGDKWEILELPAIMPDGSALWPGKYPIERLEQIRRAIGERDWTALYQQRPAPDEGAYFKRDWFRWYDEKPAALRIYGASDYAVTDGAGDYTVHLVVGIDADDNLFVLDVWRGQTNSDVWIESWLDLVRRYKPLMWAEEQGQIVKSIGPFLDKRMRESRVYCRREQVTSAADKPTRSRSIQARAAMGKIYLPSKAPWLCDFLSELLVFPAGKHDDQVDGFGLIGRMLDEMVPAARPKTPERNSLAGYARVGEDSISWRERSL